MLAILEAYHAGLLHPRNWAQNVIAGIIVGIVALPLAMAFAIASGVKPEQGLYTAIVAAFAVGVFGGSRVQIAGPTGAFVIVLANITARYGVDGLQLATIMAGVLLLVMGFFRIGSVIRYIPHPVIVGFTSGIGVIIFVGEWKDFFGLPVTLPLDASFFTKLVSLLVALPQYNGLTTVLAFLCIASIWLTPHFSRRIPGPLVALVIATVVQYYLQASDIATIGSVFGGITHHLPALQLPSFSSEQLTTLIGPAFTIALLGAIESLLSATAADKMAGTKHHSNQELIGQGLANILAPLFGGFAATGAIARTATNVRNGGNSPLAALIHSIFLIAFILLLAPLAQYIPLCSLAAILIVVAYNMSDVPHFLHIMRDASRDKVIVLLTTFLLTVFVNLVIAVSVGVTLSFIFSITRTPQTAARDV